MARTHADVDFQVAAEGKAVDFESFDAAAAWAVAHSVATGEHVTIDVVVWSREGAEALAGDDGAEQYDEDPDASVFDRIVVKAESKGRIA